MSENRTERERKKTKLRGMEENPEYLIFTYYQFKKEKTEEMGENNQKIFLICTSLSQINNSHKMTNMIIIIF